MDAARHGTGRSREARGRAASESTAGRDWRSRPPRMASPGKTERGCFLAGGVGREAEQDTDADRGVTGARTLAPHGRT